MQTFDARLTPRGFWSAALVPPVLFFGLVQAWSTAVGESAPVGQVIAVIALAQAMPLAALTWMLCSVAGYSIGAGQLVVHRVISDRTFALAQLDEAPRLENGVVTAVIAGRRLRLRVANPAACLAALTDATLERPGLCGAS